MTNVAIEATEILNKAQPKDRGEAYKALKSQGYQLQSADFNQAVKGFEEANGGNQLPPSQRAIRAEARKSALSEAHGMTATQAKKLLDKVGKGNASEQEIQTAWQTWNLTKDGKHDGKLEAADFSALFENHGNKKIDPIKEESYIDIGANILANAEVTDRGQAFKALQTMADKGNSRAAKEVTRSPSLFNKVVAEHENRTGTELEQTQASIMRKQVAVKAHEMTLTQLTKYAEGKGEPDALLWKSLQLGKQGKYGKGNPVKDLPVFVKAFEGRSIFPQKDAQQKRSTAHVSM